MPNTDPRRLYCHPATAFGLWLFFMGWLSVADLSRLALFSLVLAALLWRNGWRQCMRYLRRSRWLLAILWVAHLFGDTRAPLIQVWGWSVPGANGFMDASLAVWRWAMMLAALAVLMSRLSRDVLLAAMLVLLYPLRFLGVDPERIAVRIWLTLHYAETLLQHPASFKMRLQQLHALPVAGETAPAAVVLNRTPAGWKDAACVLGGLALGMGMKWVWPK